MMAMWRVPAASRKCVSYRIDFVDMPLRWNCLLLAVLFSSHGDLDALPGSGVHFRSCITMGIKVS